MDVCQTVVKSIGVIALAAVMAACGIKAYRVSPVEHEDFTAHAYSTKKETVIYFNVPQVFEANHSVATGALIDIDPVFQSEVSQIANVSRADWLNIAIYQIFHGEEEPLVRAREFAALLEKTLVDNSPFDKAILTSAPPEK